MSIDNGFALRSAMLSIAVREPGGARRLPMLRMMIACRAAPRRSPATGGREFR
ncbi:hypothetical protein [Nocardia lijiangensis]|uniref:hypothetical protein n=1 Tax=Nocardia lijiangensis TaxID=299618 RepID=UPI0012DE1001|nr:hypothetical protein [Nocardia lijiangensis]